MTDVKRGLAEGSQVAIVATAGKAASGVPPAAPRAAAAAQQPEPSAFARGLRSVTSRLTPTNYNMLLFRTLNRKLCLPNANDDYIAPLFMERLMPVRSWVQGAFPAMAGVTRRFVEDPAVGVPGVVNFVDARTKWLDDGLRAALDGGITQVVCIAAGYDTRAYRFARQGVKFFEVDLPDASKRKQQLVKSCVPGSVPRPTYVGADLSKITLSAALAGTDFEPHRPTFFTCEGLIYYLPAPAVSALLASVADIAAPGSRLHFDFLHQDAVDGSASYPGYDACAQSVAGKGEGFISGLPQGQAELAGALGPLGWRLDALWSPRQLAAAQLPHEPWREDVPPILTFYSYAECAKRE